MEELVSPEHQGKTAHILKHSVLFQHRKCNGRDFAVKCEESTDT